MKIVTRRLKKGDEAILRTLAREDADFDMEGRGKPLQPLGPKVARDFLADSSVLFWVAESGDALLGFLFCYLLKMRAGKNEVLLYEIGVRKGYRRKGIGKALQGVLEAWMKAKKIPESWVLADNPGAVVFYRSNGFKKPKGMAVYMTKSIRLSAAKAEKK